MFLFFILWGAFGGAATVETLHYHDCKAIDFKSPLCARELKFSKLATKK